MELDDPDKPEFASLQSYHLFAKRVRNNRRYVWPEEIQRFLDTVIATIEQRMRILDEGRILFRAQIGVDWVEEEVDDSGTRQPRALGYTTLRMKPRPDRASEGRANPAGIPVLYAGSTIETAISEVRPWVGADVSVATCKVLRSLKTLDLSVGYGRFGYTGWNLLEPLKHRPPTPEQKRSAVWNAIDNAFSRPVTRSDDFADYVPTQILAELFRSKGYDAILYKSQFGEEKGYNLAIFDPDDVEIVSCAPYRVETIKVTADQFDSAWYLNKRA